VTAVTLDLDDILFVGVAAVIAAEFVVTAYRTHATVVTALIIIRHCNTPFCSKINRSFIRPTTYDYTYSRDRKTIFFKLFFGEEKFANPVCSGITRH